MKNKNKTIVIKKKLIRKKDLIYRTIIILLLLLFGMWYLITYISINNVNNSYAVEIDNFSKLNNETIFDINKIEFYSSASATNNKTSKANWNLDISQFTDMAIYINTGDNINQTYLNSIRQLYISNVNITKPELGTPSLYYKNINNFAKFEVNESNKLKYNKFDYIIVPSGEIDFDKPQIYSNGQNPITLEFVNEKVKTNQIITDTSTDVIYDGSLLKKAGIRLDSIRCMISFKITIINYYNQKFIANVYIELPLNDELAGTSIYDGNFQKTLDCSNQYRFFRLE